ncbi:hypothetical protein Tco_0172688 [Tanacetum coccineum]
MYVCFSCLVGVVLLVKDCRMINLIMEYLVKVSKRRAFWSLNEDILKITILKTNTPYPSRKIRRIRACTHQRPQRKLVQYALRMTKVIKGEFKKLDDLKVKYVSLTCDTSLEVFNNEFNRLSGMEDDLFTCEVEVANILCDSNKDDDSEQRMSHEVDDDMGYDPSDVAFTEWLGSKNFNYKTMDHYTKKELWIYWIRGDDKVELTDEKFSDNEDEVAKVFRIDTNIFDFETPMCKTFKEFNYLLQIDLDLLTKKIEGFKTYDEYKDDWIYEWNKDIPWVDEKPWTDVGVWTEPKPITHTCKPFNYKTGCSE